MARPLGLDFGTTNSAVALATDDGATLAQFAHANGRSNTFRSILFFEAPGPNDRGRSPATAGPRAIDRYLELGGAGRLLQSLKSYMATDLFQRTNVFGEVFTLEELVAIMLRAIRRETEAQFGPIGERVVLGRPVRFANGDGGDATEELPLKRMREAAALAGFTDVVFEYEPVGAAYFYEQSLDHDETVLIGDFGGGTSDFCLMQVGPSRRKDGNRRKDILGTEGVGLAGDVFDAEIVRHSVAPSLGMGSDYRSFMDGKLVPIPPWIYEKFRRWHHLSFLKSRETMSFLRGIRSQAIHPDRIEALIHVIEDDLSYHLYRTVEGTKVSLSSQTQTLLRFVDPPTHLESQIARATFESWLTQHLEAIDRCVTRLLDATGATVRDVDQVFLTGGSSLVPCVRALFSQRFGDAKLRSGDELTSVALGLALRARDL